MKNIIKNLKDKGIENIVIKSFYKNGIEIEGLTLNTFNHEDISIAPIVYINDVKNMIDEEGLENTLNILEDIFKSKSEPKFDFEILNDKGKFLNHLYVGIQRKTEQVELIKKPCEELDGDAELYLYLKGEANPDGNFYCCKINAELLKNIKCTKEEAWATATKNTCNEATLISMSKLIFGFEIEDEIAYILSNKSNVKGASSIIHHELLSDFAKAKGESHLIIVPSTIDEVLVLLGSRWDTDDEKFLDTMRSLNGAVEPFDVLSKKFYILSF